MSDYPWSGAITITIQATDAEEWTLQLRVPDWCRNASVSINGSPYGKDASEGYYRITRRWQIGDVVTLDLDMQPELLAAHPRIDPVRASVALRRGPLIYCLEDIDQPEGVRVEDVALHSDPQPEVEWQPLLLNGLAQIHLQGVVSDLSAWGDDLYRPLLTLMPPTTEKVRLTAIPYYAWANRGANAMRVWIPTMP